MPKRQNDILKHNLPALFDSEWLNRLRRLSLVARRAGGGILTGPRATLPAGGTELTGHRDYAPGDDYARVDWNLSARHDELLTRQFHGRADCPLYLLLDCSRSMALGRPPKFDVARQVAAALCYVALANLDQVSVFGFSDRITAELGPLRDKRRTLRLARFLEELAPESGQTNLAAAAQGFVGRHRRQGLAVVVSDLYDPGGFRRGLDVLRGRGYPPRVVQLYDPGEAEPDAVGDSELYDVETGVAWQVTVTKRHLARYRRLYADFQHSVRTYCAGHGIRLAQVPVDLPADKLLLAALGARK